MQGVGESPLQTISFKITQFHSPANTELTHKQLFLFSIIFYFLSIFHQNYSSLILVDRNPVVFLLVSSPIQNLLLGSCCRLFFSGRPLY